MNEIERYNENVFESIKHIDNNRGEFWYARELQIVLEYTEWRKFERVINKAMTACKTSEINISDHFVGVDKMVNIGSGAKRKQQDYKLSRYACYLIAQNGDSRKKVIAMAQTYFAIQTRKQELSEKEYSQLTEDEKRLYQRNLTKKGNYSLNQTAKTVGVKNFDKFHNAGYKGLYNGETANDIAKRKGLRYREDIIKGENNASNTHYEVSNKIRNTIKELGGTMPEDLPTPEKSLKQIEKENNNVFLK